MVGMKNMPRVNWGEINWLPQKINWNECDGSDDMPLNSSTAACISVRNARFFQSLYTYLPLWENCFTHFRFTISSDLGQHTGKDICFQGEKFRYNNIFLQTQINHLAHSRSHYDRCLEIWNTESSPVSVHGVLSHTQFFFLSDNKFVKILSDLGDASYMKELKECRVERCSEMKTIFMTRKTPELDILPCLERIFISNLPKLRIVSEGPYGRGSFALLKHVYLERCPKLASVFSSNVSLQSLETLEIKFCCRLKEVFQGAIGGECSPDHLHTIILWELRKLESICSVQLQALQKMSVRGCPKLRKLPLRDVKQHSSIVPQPIISGEPEWWNEIVWEDTDIKNRIHFKGRQKYGV